MKQQAQADSPQNCAAATNMNSPEALALQTVEKIYGPKTIPVPENILVARVLWTREEAVGIIQAAIEQALKTRKQERRRPQMAS